MHDDPTPFFLMGMILGVISTLLIQAYGRRKARQAASAAITSQPAANSLTEKTRGSVEKLADRVAVLERIATERPQKLADEIESLR